MITRRELLAMLAAAGVAIQLPVRAREEIEKPAPEIDSVPARFSWTPEGGKAVEIPRVETVSVEMEPMEFPIDGVMESRPSGSGTVTVESHEFWDADLATLARGRLRFGIGRSETFDVQAMVVECTRDLMPGLRSQRTVFRYWGPFTQSLA